MNIEKLNEALIDIIEKKIQLSKLNYSDEDYDTVEEELHDLEDDFLENYGSYMEDALHVVHDEFCPDNDVLLPIAYLANKYIKTSGGGDSPEYKAPSNEGVIVDVDDFPGKICRLVFEPNPVKLVMNIEKGDSLVVWQANK